MPQAYPRCHSRRRVGLMILLPDPGRNAMSFPFCWSLISFLLLRSTKTILSSMFHDRHVLQTIPLFPSHPHRTHKAHNFLPFRLEAKSAGTLTSLHFEKKDAYSCLQQGASKSLTIEKQGGIEKKNPLHSFTILTVKTGRARVIGAHTLPSSNVY